MDRGRIRRHMAKNNAEMSMDDLLGESKFSEFLSTYSKQIAYAVLALIVILFLFFRLLNQFSLANEKNYIEAARNASALSSLETSDAAVEKLRAAVANYPDLQSTYDGLIAQTLLVQGKTEEALPYAQRNIKRISTDSLSHFENNAEIALLSAQKEWEKAYEKSLSLKELIKNDSSYASLYLLTLFRIAYLEDRLGKTDLARASWSEFKEQEKIHPEAYQKFTQSINLGAYQLKS